jgi:hypothetical protein
LNKAGFKTASVAKVLYPWDANLAEGEALVGHPPSWDWFFLARP